MPRVQVYERKSGVYKRISCFPAPAKHLARGASTVHVLYGGAPATHNLADTLVLGRSRRSSRTLHAL